MTSHNHSAWRLDGAMWQIIALGILLVGKWPLSACSGYHGPLFQKIQVESMDAI